MKFKEAIVLLMQGHEMICQGNRIRWTEIHGFETYRERERVWGSSYITGDPNATWERYRETFDFFEAVARIKQGKRVVQVGSDQPYYIHEGKLRQDLATIPYTYTINPCMHTRVLYQEAT